VPLKLDLTQGSETSAKPNLTPWRHPKEHIHTFMFYINFKLIIYKTKDRAW
jgi:hypothetical protein